MLAYLGWSTKTPSSSPLAYPHLLLLKFIPHGGGGGWGEGGDRIYSQTSDESVLEGDCVC